MIPDLLDHFASLLSGDASIQLLDFLLGHKRWQLDPPESLAKFIKAADSAEQLHQGALAGHLVHQEKSDSLGARCCSVVHAPGQVQLRYEQRVIFGQVTQPIQVFAVDRFLFGVDLGRVFSEYQPCQALRLVKKLLV